MILRRLTTALRKQDWFTVLIETLIVVFGVFIGLQVNNWNEARQTRQTAAQYEERLRADLHNEAFNYLVLRDYYRDVLKAAETAYSGLAGEIEISDADLIVAAFRASQYNWIERHRATFDELVASGKLELIGDPAFRTRITTYYSMNLLETTVQASLSSDYRRAFRMFAPPDMHNALGAQCGDRETGELVFTLDYECDFDWPEEQLATYARTLSADEEMFALLRLQIANLTSSDFELQTNYNHFRMDEFMRKQDAE